MIASSCASCAREPTAPNSPRRSTRRTRRAWAPGSRKQEPRRRRGRGAAAAVLDAQGRSRAWINGRPATLAHLKDLGERLVDLHGQHAHQSLAQPVAQRNLVDAFGGFTTLAREVAESFRAWRAAIDRCAAAAQAAQATSTEREFLDTRRRELAALAVTESEWADLSAAQSRLANAADLIEAATQGGETLSEGDAALTRQLAQLTQRLKASAANDPALAAIVALLEPAAVELEEAARALRDYLRRLDLDPKELQRVEARLTRDPRPRRVAIACGPRRCPHCWPRPRRASLRLPNPPTPSCSRGARPRRAPPTAPSPNSCPASAALPRPNSRTASRRRCRR